MRKILAVCIALAACIACLAGCAGGGSLNGEVLEETGAFKVTAENAGAGSAVKAEAAVALGEGKAHPVTHGSYVPLMMMEATLEA